MMPVESGTAVSSFSLQNKIPHLLRIHVRTPDVLDLHYNAVYSLGAIEQVARDSAEQSVCTDGLQAGVVVSASHVVSVFAKKVLTSPAGTVPALSVSSRSSGR